MRFENDTSGQTREAPYFQLAYVPPVDRFWVKWFDWIKTMVRKMRRWNARLPW